MKLNNILKNRNETPSISNDSDINCHLSDTTKSVNNTLLLSSNRLTIGDNPNWANQVADLIIEKNPNIDTYILTAGISPSGIVHFGNFRDVITTLTVIESLKQKGKKTRFIFSWDNYDRFRKVPKGVDSCFQKYIGMPLTSVPDPLGELSSYAERYQKDFEESIRDLGIDLEFKYQTDEYKSGKYDKLIELALINRKELAKILLSFMSEKSKVEKGINEQDYINEFYPITLYSRFSKKDNTKILSINGTLITYKCLDTGKNDTIDFTKDRIVKLNWKIDWPMRWLYEGVVFEPGGKDHASPGGSYDASSVISNEVFKNTPPFFVGYEFIGIQGLEGKISGSAGNALSVKQLLEIYDQFLLKWLYLRKTPSQTFNLAFDSEIYRQYEEFDSFIDKVIKGEATEQEIDLFNKLHFNLNLTKEYKPIPFRQIVAFGQIAQWDIVKLKQHLEKVGYNYSDESLRIRLEKGKNWIETYNKNESISLLGETNKEYLNKMSEEQKEKVRKLLNGLKSDISLDELNILIYAIPKKEGLSIKENSKLQRSFFIDVYNLLIGKDTGPRLSTFIYLLEREQILKLLDI